MGKQIPYDTLDEAINCVMNKIDMKEASESEDIKAIIEETIFQLPMYQTYSLVEKGEIAKVLFHRMCAYDVLQPLLEEREVTEIMCNGYNKIFVERYGVLHKTDVTFSDEQHYRALLQRIAADVNRKIDFSSPIVDARLMDGSRVNIVLNPVAINGPILTIRKFSKRVFSLEDLHSMESLSEAGLEILRTAVQNRLNIFISGGTGSGKTTLLNALCREIDEVERIITIEDSAEITIESVENVVTLEKRNANLEGVGEISIAELIRTALRMRPDRIIVGEIRGAEAIDMLQAMNTGHSGSISTGHANNTLDMLRRIETMVLSGLEIPVDAIRQQITSAIDIIVHTERLKNGLRRIASIDRLIGHDKAGYILESVVIEGTS